MGAKVTFDGDNRLIIVNSGVTSLDVEVDLYSDGKEDWKTDPDLKKLRFPFRVIGGDPLGAGLNAGAYFFLQNQAGADWRIRPQEADHELVITGNLYAEDASLPIFVPTLGDYTVTIRLETSSLTQEKEVPGTLSPSDKQDIANYVWNHTTGVNVDTRVNLIRKIEEDRWKIDNNELIIYDDDGTTILMKFSLLDKDGQPTMKEVFERVPVE
ncbi:MAG: hypothetical protein ACE5J9_05530 [Methanosarcinales archaeon]